MITFVFVLMFVLGLCVVLALYFRVRVVCQRFAREGDWYAGVDMSGGFVTSRKFDNLMAFWPGMQTLIGKMEGMGSGCGLEWDKS